MNKYFILPILIFGMSILGCSKENFATLEVVNQKNCLHNLYNGNNSNGSFLGAVGANQTKEFEIALGGANNGFESYYADPQCSTIQFGESFSGIEFRKGKTTTILIN